MPSPPPFLDLEPKTSPRDPAVIWHDGVYHCFYTAVEYRPDGYDLYLDVVRSPDLKRWSQPERLTTTGLNFSSPGNIMRHEDKWVLCLQSYPIPSGQEYGSEDSRLWLMESTDLYSWSEPRLLQLEGCQANWTPSHRQIDPYLVQHDNRFWCFYKTSGQLGLLVSEDLQTWTEASPDRPVLSASDTPDGSTAENPCVIRDGEEFVLFFAPCRPERGIGVARSRDLLNWEDIHYLDFPELDWAPGGPTAAMVLDTRPQLVCWTMFFHGDRHGAHGAAMGMAWSKDLEEWRLER